MKPDISSMRKKAISMASIMLILVDFDHAMMAAVGELCLVVLYPMFRRR